MPKKTNGLMAISEAVHRTRIVHSKQLLQTQVLFAQMLLNLIRQYHFKAKKTA